MNRSVKLRLLLAILLMMAPVAFCDAAADYFARGLGEQNKGDLDAAITDYSKALELKTDFADAYNGRGVAKNAKGDLGGAIADYSKAIEIKPDFCFAYNNRGLAKKAKGDLDGAIADYSKAIEIKPDYEHAYGNRGDARQGKGDLEGAIADYTKIIELNPKLADAYNGRGCLHYYARAFADALIDFRKAIELNSSGDYFYTHFWIWLVRTRLGEAEIGTVELQKCLAGRSLGKPDDWTAKVGQFLVGQLAEPEFLAAAKNADPKTKAGQLCEAYFYAGSKHLFAGDMAVAADFFQKSIATDKRTFFEYMSAVAELRFLKEQKN